MTVKELIEMLSAIEDQNAEIYFPVVDSTADFLPINCIMKVNEIFVVDSITEMDY